ncbi:MAG: hypothetical protein GEV13_24580 [Rhodospirillales bacterium]|nr:hypothetical protein [Rhodospirillales bacterium]
MPGETPRCRGGQSTNIHAVVDPAISRQQNSVERFFYRLKPIRCVAVRLDKLARNFLATVLFAYESTTQRQTLGAGERPIEFSGDRPKTVDVEGVGRRRRKTLPTGREAFPDRNVRCPSLQEAKEFAVAGRQRPARDRDDGGHAWAIPRQPLDAP